MRLSELRGLKVRTLDGRILGRVHEVHCDNGRVTALKCGSASLIERLTSRSAGRRIPWECVRRISRTEVVVTPDPPRRKSAGSASRTRRGTRQPTSPRSKH
jgi:sporulation protein YlmC with PRC-barrel domain